MCVYVCKIFSIKSHKYFKNIVTRILKKKKGQAGAISANRYPGYQSASRETFPSGWDLSDLQGVEYRYLDQDRWTSKTLAAPIEMFSAASVPAAEAALACGNHELPPLFCSARLPTYIYINTHIHTRARTWFNEAIVSIGRDPRTYTSFSKCVPTQVFGGISTARYGRSLSSASVTATRVKVCVHLSKPQM